MVIFFFKHDAIDIADPSSMQEAWERGTGGLRFDSSWELRIFSLSHAHEKIKNIFLFKVFFSVDA